MKITIDTKEDSHEDIKKVIKMLYSLVGEQEIISNSANIFGDNALPAVSSQNNQNDDMFSMFNSDSNVDESSLDKNKGAEEKQEEVKFDIPDIQEYI